MKFKTITARIDEESSNQLDAIKSFLGIQHTTDVLVQAIHVLFGVVQEKCEIRLFLVQTMKVG